VDDRGRGEPDAAAGSPCAVPGGRLTFQGSVGGTWRSGWCKGRSEGRRRRRRAGGVPGGGGSGSLWAFHTHPGLQDSMEPTVATPLAMFTQLSEQMHCAGPVVVSARQRRREGQEATSLFSAQRAGTDAQRIMRALCRVCKAEEKRTSW